MRPVAWIVGLAATLFLVSSGGQAAFQGMPRGLKSQLERIRLDAPALAPFAHVRFCLQYAEDCEVKGIAFRGGALSLSEQRWNELLSVNTDVNRGIRPQPNTGGLTAERWLIHPKSGDCNDYAVTKRHELLRRGWPSHALLLAEVVMSSGDHHLVLVVRAKEGDFVLDNLHADIRPWSRTPYQWVRMQTPSNPKFWSRLATA
jgi:predicted transglutaminase-like cysteine proteinase